MAQALKHLGLRLHFPDQRLGFKWRQPDWAFGLLGGATQADQVQYLNGWFKAHYRGRRSSDSLFKQFGGPVVEAS